MVTEMTESQLNYYFIIIFTHMFALPYFVSYELPNIHMHPLLASTKLQVL